MHVRRRSYRSKITRPCDGCRIRKIACIQDLDENGKATSCTLCRHREVPCTFVTRPLPRKKTRDQSEQGHCISPGFEAALSPPASEAPSTATPAADCDESTQSPSFLGIEGAAISESSGASPWVSSSFVESVLCDTVSVCDTTSPGTNDHISSTIATQNYQHPAASTDIYGYIIDALSPWKGELIRHYYEHVHPSLPILERRDVIEARIRRKQIPNCLQAMILLHGSCYGAAARSRAEDLCVETSIERHICSLLALESRYPALQGLQTGLLYLELPMLQQTSDPNQARAWGLQALLVSMSQTLGLHKRRPKKDSGGQSIEEGRLGRIIWWHVFIRDKWMAYFLDQPSHIPPRSFDTPPLTLVDFSDEHDNLNIRAVSWGNTLMALLKLTQLLSDVFEAFYTVSQEPDPSTGVSQGLEFIRRLGQWKQDHALTEEASDAYVYTNHLLSFTVCLAIHHGLSATYRAAQQDGDTAILGQNIGQSIRQGFHQLLESISLRCERGLWLSFNAGNLIVVAEAVEGIATASRNEADFTDRLDLLEKLQEHLKVLLAPNDGHLRCHDQVTMDFVKPSLARIDELRAGLLVHKYRQFSS